MMDVLHFFRLNKGLSGFGTEEQPPRLELSRKVYEDINTRPEALIDEDLKTYARKKRGLKNKWKVRS